MEVGPLNNIRPPVEGPTEGQTGRVKDANPEKNRLVTDAVKAGRVSADSLNVRMRNVQLNEQQEKSGLASVARDVILKLIDSMGKVSAGQADKGEVEKALGEMRGLKFNGKTVFDGQTLQYRASDGSSVSVKFPKASDVEKQVLADLKKANADKTEPNAFKEINKAGNQLNNLVSKIKGDIKQSVSISNKQASHSPIKQIDYIKEFIKNAGNDGQSKMPSFKAYSDMSSKAVKLLK